MADHTIYWNRFQTKSDKQFDYLASKLKRAGLIHSSFIDRHHLTNILNNSNEKPFPLTQSSDLLTLFTPEELLSVQDVVIRYFPELEIPPPVPSVEVEPASTPIELLSRSGGKIIDA